MRFHIDVSTQHSVLTRADGPMTSKKTWVQGATGARPCSWTIKWTVDLRTGPVTHSFMVLPECSYPLLGRDLLAKTRAQIHFDQKWAHILDRMGKPIQVLTLIAPSETEYHLHEPPITNRDDVQQWLKDFPLAWAETGGMGLARHRTLVYVELKSVVDPAQVRQYPMPLEARRGITPHICKLLAERVLRPCRSSWNTPLLPVRKPNLSDY